MLNFSAAITRLIFGCLVSFSIVGYVHAGVQSCGPEKSLSDKRQCQSLEIQKKYRVLDNEFARLLNSISSSIYADHYGADVVRSWKNDEIDAHKKWKNYASAKCELIAFYMGGATGSAGETLSCQSDLIDLRLKEIKSNIEDIPQEG